MQTIVFQATAAQNATQQLKGSRSRQSVGSTFGSAKRSTSDRLSLRPEIDAEETDLWKFLCERPLDVDCVEEHVRSGECDTNIRDKSFGWSPVLMAANAGETGLLKLLLDSKAKSDVVCHEGNSALILAARSGHLETVEFLMSRKVDVNLRNAQGWSALHWCCINGHEDISTSLLAASADFNLVDNKGRTACMWAARHGYLEILEALLVCGINLGAEDHAGLTAMDHAQEHMQLRTVIAAAVEVNRDLLEAARRADKQEVRSALQRGADVNLHDEDGFNALMWSALHGSLDLVTTLTRHGANPKLVMNSGDHIDKLGDQHLAVGDSLRSILGANDRMLDKAVRKKWDEVEEELRIGAWINVRDKDKRTALMWAAKHGAPQAISRLVDKGAHMDERDIFGWTATLFAVWSKSCEAIAMLYYLSADFAIRSFEGDSALHVAVRADDGVAVQLLLTAKSDVEEQDVEGYSPLMLAAANGLLNAASTLLAWGGNMKQTDHHKRTPFMLAIMNGHRLMALLMMEPLRAPPPIPGFEHMNGPEKKEKKSKSHDKKSSSGKDESGKSHDKKSSSGKDESGKPRDKKSNKSGEAVANQAKSTPKKSDSKVLFSTPSTPASEARRPGGKISSVSKAKLKNVNAPRATKGESPTSLIQMAAQQRQEVLGHLPKISAKSLLKEVDKDGRTPLHLAVIHKHMDIMQMLISKASDINAVDLRGNTVLHEAARKNQEPMVCKLLEAACNIGLMNKDHKLPIDLATDVSIKGMLQRTVVTRALPTTDDTEHRAVTRSSKQRPIFRAKIEGLPTHLASDILENNVRALIKKLGASNPVSLEVAVDPITSRPHGYASVEFSDAAEVDLTIRGDGIVMEGKTLHIFKDSIAPKKRLMTS